MRHFKVLFIQRHFSHYRKPVYDILKENYNILVLHSNVIHTIKSEHTDYSKHIPSFKYGPKETNYFLLDFKTILSFKPHIIVYEFNPSILSLPLAWILSRFIKAKFVLWGHGYNRRKGFNPQKNFISRLRLLYLKIADAVLLYDKSTKKLFAQYIPAHKIFVATNTLDTRSLNHIRKNLEKLGVNKIKEQLHITTQYNIVYIGRLIKEKMPLLAVQIFETLLKQFPAKAQNIALHIIGDGEEKEKIEQYVQNQKIKNVYLHGAIYDPSIIGRYLYMADLVLNPGYVGLNVNHAFCFHCPVFTFKQGEHGPFHSPEVEYLIDGQTGFMVEPFSIEQMARKIAHYLNNPSLQNNVKKHIAHIVENEIAIEKMIDGFKKCFTYLLETDAS